MQERFELRSIKIINCITSFQFHYVCDVREDRFERKKYDSFINNLIKAEENLFRKIEENSKEVDNKKKGDFIPNDNSNFIFVNYISPIHKITYYSESLKDLRIQKYKDQNEKQTNKLI